MFIAHLPAGFITTKLLFPYAKGYSVSYKAFLFWGMFGAIIPDLDMFYFYLIDHHQHHHHRYASHFPIVWLCLLIIASLWFYKASTRKNAVLALIFSLNAFIHLCLDSIVGDIWWFAPFIDQSFSLATVPAHYPYWWLNFILHWSFALEIIIISWATYLWNNTKQENRPNEAIINNRKQ